MAKHDLQTGPDSQPWNAAYKDKYTLQLGKLDAIRSRVFEPFEWESKELRNQKSPPKDKYPLKQLEHIVSLNDTEGPT